MAKIKVTPVTPIAPKASGAPASSGAAKRKAPGAKAKANGSSAKRPRVTVAPAAEDDEEEEDAALGREEVVVAAEDEDVAEEEEEEGEEGGEEAKVATAVPKKSQTKAKTATKAKAPPKPKATKAKASGSATTPPKRRKTRTLEDKQRENAPMASPFFVETGAEWNATNVDFEELRELRGMWELPAACHVLWLLQQPLTLRFSNTLLEYEAALLSPEASTILEDAFTKLLLKKSERDCLAPGIGLKYEWWNKQLREYYMAMYDKMYALLRKAGEKPPSPFLDDEETEEDEDEPGERDVELSDDEWLALDILKSRLEGLGDECPLKHRSFSDLPIGLRCRILLNLCEAVIEDPANSDYIRQMEEDDLRIEPLGRDRAGNWFYFFPQFYEERRIYRLDAQSNSWALWAKGDAAFREMLTAMKSIRGRKLPGEQELIDHLEVIMEQIQEEDEARARQLEKATKKAILEAIPRKRSLRIQVKQIEQIEKQKEEEEARKVLSQEEIAEMKRAELLRKVEQEAAREAREREREARRLAKEEQEREAAQAERELRRQRRLEKEKTEEEALRRLEEEKKKQEEARKHRAMLRQSAGFADSESADEAQSSEEANGGTVAVE